MGAPPAFDGNDDHISELPEALISDILSRLGTAKAARTVVLSTRFRDAWLATPLRLDDLELPAPARGTGFSKEPWAVRADAVTRVLASCPGPVALFHLSRTTFRSRVFAGEAWLRDLAAQRAREVYLFFRPEWCHDALADPLLGCPTLETLALGKCSLSDAGASAAGLTELTLSETNLSEAAPQSVLSGCPALRSVMLKHVHGFHRIRVRSCRSLVLLGVWHYKNLEEITVEDAPCLERVLCSVRLTAAITVVGAPMLTALGYAVVRIPYLFEGETAPQEVGKGLRAPLYSVKILTISVKFSCEEETEKVISLLELFPCLETLHVKSSDNDEECGAVEDDTIGSIYYPKCDPIRCFVSHLKSMRLECNCNHTNNSMLEFASFLLARAHVLQFMRIRSKLSGLSEWVTKQQNLLSQSHPLSLETEVMFEGIKRRDGFKLLKSHFLNGQDCHSEDTPIFLALKIHHVKSLKLLQFGANPKSHNLQKQRLRDVEISPEIYFTINSEDILRNHGSGSHGDLLDIDHHIGNGSDQTECVQIFINCRPSVPLTVNLDEPSIFLMENYKKATRIKDADLYFLYKNKVIHPCKTLRSYGIVKGSTLDLRARIRGGKPTFEEYVAENKDAFMDMVKLPDGNLSLRMTIQGCRFLSSLVSCFTFTFSHRKSWSGRYGWNTHFKIRNGTVRIAIKATGILQSSGMIADIAPLITFIKDKFFNKDYRLQDKNPPYIQSLITFLNGLGKSPSFPDTDKCIIETHPSCMTPYERLLLTIGLMRKCKGLNSDERGKWDCALDDFKIPFDWLKQLEKFPLFKELIDEAGERGEAYNALAKASNAFRLQRDYAVHGLEFRFEKHPDSKPGDKQVEKFKDDDGVELMLPMHMNDLLANVLIGLITGGFDISRELSSAVVQCTECVPQPLHAVISVPIDDNYMPTWIRELPESERRRLMTRTTGAAIPPVARTTGAANPPAQSTGVTGQASSSTSMPLSQNWSNLFKAGNVDPVTTVASKPLPEDQPAEAPWKQVKHGRRK